MATPWDDLIKDSPLAQTNWNDYFQAQVPSTGWWNEQPAPFAYAPERRIGGSFDYDPGGVGDMYSPESSLTMRMIDSDIDQWLRREHPELYDFTTGVQYGGVAGVGQVAQDPNFGQFSRTPAVYAELQAAANKYGVPVNFLQAIIAKESSGDWASNSRPVSVSSRNGKRIHGYVGVFEDAAASWGFNFDALIGNRAGQIEMLASGLRGMYDRLRQQNPEWGWLNVAAMHYSGDPTMRHTPGDSYQHGTTAQYVAEAERWWKMLDAQAGNTWSNYTDVNQNTGIGSPQTQAWGRYSQWDEALVGLAANTGAPANMLKAVLRYGDGAGLGFSNSFDTRFSQTATQIADTYRQTGDWNTAVATALGLDPNGSQYAQIKTYWDELNADASGIFGGRPGASLPSSQFDAIWGDFQGATISQGMGLNGFSRNHIHPGGMYHYAYGYGIEGHPGVDVGMPVGTTLYSPVHGTVIIDGGSGYFYDSVGTRWQAGRGELRILLDNGHHLILGHNSRNLVTVGQRVTPGMAVALSGYTDAPHVHVEYRIPDTGTSTGWRAVDPREALGGQFTGFHQGARTGLGYTTPLTFQNLMRAAASGQPIPTGAVYAQGGGNSAWTTWLRNEMQGIQNQEIRAGQMDYGSIYNLPGGGIG